MASKVEQAFAVWITGLPASGKSTIAGLLKNLLDERGVDVAVLESDVLRKIFDNTGYGATAREAFYRQLVWTGVLLTGHGVPVIFDATAHRRNYRDEARRQISKFVEVFMDVPLEVCIGRDPKGIYHSTAGDVPGLHSEYEPPEKPDLVIDGVHEVPGDTARRILGVLIEKGYLP